LVVAGGEEQFALHGVHAGVLVGVGDVDDAGEAGDASGEQDHREDGSDDDDVATMTSVSLLGIRRRVAGLMLCLSKVPTETRS